MSDQKCVLVAGATGYLGKFAVQVFKERGYRVKVLTRSRERLAEPGPFTAPDQRRSAHFECRRRTGEVCNDGVISKVVVHDVDAIR